MLYFWKNVTVKVLNRYERKQEKAVPGLRSCLANREHQKKEENFYAAYPH